MAVDFKLVGGSYGSRAKLAQAWLLGAPSPFFQATHCVSSASMLRTAAANSAPRSGVAARTLYVSASSLAASSACADHNTPEPYVEPGY